MVDFKGLTGKANDIDYGNIFDVFESLDRKATHTELRPSQIEVLDQLSLDRNREDKVIKLSTGAGKTSLGLLYLYSYMKKHKASVAYLCPTKQLVEQVIAEAASLGIPVEEYGAGEPHPSIEAIQGNEVIVCTYRKLFNGRSSFNRQDVALRPEAIILDDVHNGIELVKDAFRVVLKGENRDALVSLVEPMCKEYKRSTWNDIVQKEPYQLLEVPFWIWNAYLPQIEKLLNSFSKDIGMQLPLLNECLQLSRCLISADSVEIVPFLPTFDKFPAFTAPVKRLFMSATLADDSVLVRELGLSYEAAITPIVPSSDRGVGERMVLAPSLIDKNFDRPFMIELCKELSKKQSVVVLTSSFAKSKDWANAGAFEITKENISEAVADLRLGLKNFVVMAQRYDGVNLPDEACRILVMDGLPQGETLQDRQDHQNLSLSGAVVSKIVYRIEQGMGRSVRSHADYAVVLLVGDDLAHFIAKTEVLDLVTESTRRQLEVAIQLSKIIKEEDDQYLSLKQTINQCLQRDESWKGFYKQEVKDKLTDDFIVNEQLCMFSSILRKSYELSLSNDPVKGSELLENALRDTNLSSESEAIYLQTLASLIALVDEPKAFKVQRGAHNINKNLMRPPIAPIRSKREPTIQSKLISDWLLSFEPIEGARSEFSQLVPRLAFTNSHVEFEAALKELGRLLGFESSRPEKEEDAGPDCLWMDSEIVFVIEAKNEKTSPHFSKKEAGQMQVSKTWFEKNYPNHNAVVIPLTISNAEIAQNDAEYPNDALLMTEADLQGLLVSFEGLLTSVITQGQIFANADSIAQQLIQYKLRAAVDLTQYTRAIGH